MKEAIVSKSIPGTKKERDAIDKALRETLRKLEKKLGKLDQKKVTNIDAPKYEKLFLQLIKSHTRKLFNNMKQYMEKRALHYVIYNHAQQWRIQQAFKKEVSKAASQDGAPAPWIGLVSKSAADDEAYGFISSLFTGEDMEKAWFFQDDFNEKYTRIGHRTAGNGAGNAFANMGVFIDFDAKNPWIAKYLESRKNLIKDLPTDQFKATQKMLKELYYDKGLHPSKIAKEFQFANLWEETYKNRSVAIAHTETMAITNEARWKQGFRYNMTHKEWYTAGIRNNPRTEHDDNEAEGMIKIELQFSSGQYYPHAGPADLVVNCKCSFITMRGEGENPRADTREAIIHEGNPPARKKSDLMPWEKGDKYKKYRDLCKAAVDASAIPETLLKGLKAVKFSGSYKYFMRQWRRGKKYQSILGCYNGHTKILRMRESFRGRHAEWYKRHTYTAAHSYDDIVGYYHDKGFTIIHEIGHHVDGYSGNRFFDALKEISGADKATTKYNKFYTRWKMYSDKQSIRVSSYAKTNIKEHFAEVFSFYYSTPATKAFLKTVEPKAFKFMEEMEKLLLGANK